MRTILCAATLSLLLCAPAIGDDNWPQWRGPSLNGTSNSSGLPEKWSDGENVKWKVKLPSWSGATPAIWGDRIFVASGGEPADGAKAPVIKKMGGDRLP